MLRTDYDLSDTVYLKLSSSDTVQRTHSTPLVCVDSPYIYLTEAFSSVIQKDLLSNLTVHPLRDTTFFFAVEPTSSNSIFYKTYDTVKQQSILTKLSPNTLGNKIRRYDLEKQVDGFFCTDGVMHYEPENGRLVYVYFYRNRFVSLDSNMNILYNGRTIDTNSHVKIRVSHITSIGQVTLASPPAMVNKMSCVDGNYLYINSKLLANNENKYLFDKCSVIDVYSLKEEHYLSSFYLHDIGKEKVRGFRIANNTVVALYDHYLATFRLSLDKAVGPAISRRQD